MELTSLLHTEVGVLIPGTFESRDPNQISQDLLGSRPLLASSSIVCHKCTYHVD